MARPKPLCDFCCDATPAVMSVVVELVSGSGSRRRRTSKAVRCLCSHHARAIADGKSCIGLQAMETAVTDLMWVFASKKSAQPGGGFSEAH